jgi:hypothetical protein
MRMSTSFATTAAPRTTPTTTSKRCQASTAGLFDVFDLFPPAEAPLAMPTGGHAGFAGVAVFSPGEA